MAQNPLFREEYLKKKRKARFLKLGLFFFFVVLVFVGLIFLSRLDRFRISGIQFSGGLLVYPTDVEKETNDFLSGNYFWFFPKNNIFLYSQKSLANDLKDKFKRIDTISIDSIDFKTLKIVIKERGLFALWCRDSKEETPDEKCYFMDNNGIIFSEAPIFSGDAYFKYYGSVPDQDNPIGSTYLASSTEFVEISQFVDRIKSMSIRPIYLVSNGEGQFNVFVSGNGKIIFDDTQDFSKTADNLESLLKTISSSTISATSTDITSNIDYIDLRFGNKLFYKLK